MADFFSNTRKIDQISIIDLHGYLDAHTAPQLETILNSHIDLKQYKNVVDFTGLKYISSA